MMIKAQVENGIVVNVIDVDPNNVPDWCADWPEITEAGIGWTYDGHSFSEPPEPPVDLEKLAAQIRAQRDQLLTASDWTQMPDAPVDQAAWATYRQALRDIPQQAGFPTDITWPTKPE
jgi:hypothetical protein